MNERNAILIFREGWRDSVPLIMLKQGLLSDIPCSHTDMGDCLSKITTHVMTLGFLNGDR